MTIRVKRLPDKLVSDDKRVVARLFQPEPRLRRMRAIVKRIMSLGEEETMRLLTGVLNRFSSRHKNIETIFREHCSAVSRYVESATGLTETYRLLIGAYFTHEYSIEAAALFNPSMVPHPDQDGMKQDSIRFIMSLRATGEGHVSSIVFREGEVDGQGEIHLYSAPRFAYSTRPLSRKSIEKNAFIDRLSDLGLREKVIGRVMETLPDVFDVYQLEKAVEEAGERGDSNRLSRYSAGKLLWLANADYELRFASDCKLSETVIFPSTSSESKGMEDLRLVHFEDDGGKVHYYGTYTAFDGFRILPMLLETSDFRAYRVSPISGRYARNKGMALFPKKIGGQYMMIGRYDGENLFLMRSRDLHHWDDAKKIQEPVEPWEFVQIGNCGSPLETESGWILFTHGVGPVREYCMGALLLDRNDPSRVIGRLREPLIFPHEAERDGYVPNVVYSCGAMIHRGRVILPFAMSDEATSFITMRVEYLLDRLVESRV